MSQRYRAVKGKLPKKVDMHDWDEVKLLKVVKFIDFFMDGDKMNITPETRKAMELQDDLVFDEIMTRIDVPFGKGMNNNDFRMRFITMTRVFLGYLKQNPHLVTDEMYEILKKSQRMSWAAQAFTTETTDIGAEVVVMDKRETTESGHANQSPAQTNPQTAEVMYNQAILSLATTLKDMTRGMKRSDLQKMKIEDKLRIANSLVQTLQRSFQNYKPNVAVFKQLNIHNASRDDLEKAFSDYNETQ